MHKTFSIVAFALVALSIGSVAAAPYIVEFLFYGVNPTTLSLEKSADSTTGPDLRL
jgi:hypothetical protein